MILFLHQAGWAIWLGAGLTFMVWGPLARNAPLETWAHTWETLAKIQRWLVAPGAAVATITGLILSMQYAQRGLSMGSLWLIVMQTAGLVAGVLAVAVATPLANKLAFLAFRSLETGEKDARVEQVRSRLALVSSIAGALVIVSLYFAAAKPA
ncbi:MAG TPA: hypothetical protein VNL98_04325 [Gemmatimonadales bacterium]|nr:hypothetical protein [Gemmatimonadales bacterium]